MFWRRTTSCELACLIALTSATCSYGEEKATESNNSNEPAASTGEIPATSEPAQGDKEAVEIPLSEIWAYDMPGTKDIRRLEDQKKLEGLVPSELVAKSFVHKIQWSLSRTTAANKDRVAEPGFVVLGNGLKALEESNAVLSGTKKRSESFPFGKELTLVFYSRLSPRYVHLDEVLKSEREIIVRYHFHSHGLRESTTHFALVPLGSSLTGTVNVRIERMPDTTSISKTYPQSTPRGVEKAKQTVCESFAFGVTPMGH